MLSKEEIKIGLTEELKETIIANECGLSTNDFSKTIEILKSALEYIKDLEANNYEQNNIINSYIEREQKIIEKLEETIDFAKTSKDSTTKAKIEALENVLKILKG